jgi:hypothetical protein
MTKKDLVKVIQEVVRREVQKEVKKIFIKEQTSLTDNAPVLSEIMEQKVSEPKEEIKYTKNTALNSVLNETVGLSKKQTHFEEYPTMGGGTFDKSRMSELMGYGQTEEGKRDMVAVDTLQKAGKTVNDVPEHITNALTKDYSGLMKALDKKKQGGLG